MKAAEPIDRTCASRLFGNQGEYIMKDKERAKDCCSREDDRLVDEIAACENKTSSQDERHRCYCTVAKESGLRARKCIDAS